jgi:hypothetical protein
MRKVPWYVVVIAILLGLYSLALYKRPAKTDWTPTLVNRHKIPYGSYILFSALDSLFGYKPDVLRSTPYEFCGDTSSAGTSDLYMFIAVKTAFSGTDAKAILDYASLGNEVFISSENIGDALSDSLGLELSRDFSMDSLGTRLVNPALGNDRAYGMKRGTITGHVSRYDTARSVVLGMNSRGQVNYLMQRRGKGRIFIHTAPGMYTNYSLLEHDNLDYVSRSLSYLSYDPGGFYWDEYYKQGREGETSPLRVLLARPMLKAALYTALIAMLLYMIFQSKRRQRIIPVVTPPRNSTVDFVETIGQVYLGKGNHRNIALKQITYLFEQFRSRYGLDTSVPDDALARKLAHRSGFPEAQSLAMMELIRHVRSEESISDQHLIRLDRYIQEFHKYSDQ